jgi:hypothetical protein
LGVVQTCGRKLTERNTVDQGGICIDQTGKPMDELGEIAGHANAVSVAGSIP